MDGAPAPAHPITKVLTKINIYKTQYPAVSGCGGDLRRGQGSGIFPPVLIAFLCSTAFYEKLFVFPKIFQHDGAAAGGAGMVKLDDFVGQVVTERRGDGQGLHLLGGGHPAERHPTHVLQTGDATRTLPEVHTTITSPGRKHKHDDKLHRGRWKTVNSSQDCTDTFWSHGECSSECIQPAHRHMMDNWIPLRQHNMICVFWMVCVPYPAARTLPSAEKAQQRPLESEAMAWGALSSMLQKRTSLSTDTNTQGHCCQNTNYMQYKHKKHYGKCRIQCFSRLTHSRHWKLWWHGLCCFTSCLSAIAPHVGELVRAKASCFSIVTVGPAQTHYTIIKELVATEADCCVVSRQHCLGYKVVLEHIAEISANGQLAHTLCTCVKGNNSPYQQAAVVSIRHSKRQPGTAG